MAKSGLLKEDALNIAQKLGADVKKDGKHQLATWRHDGKLIFNFGIRHGKDSSHGHLVGENKVLRLNETRACALARCTISKDEYIKILKAKGVI